MENLLNFLFSLSRTNSIISRNICPNGLDFSDYMIIHCLAKAEGKKLRRIDLAHKLGLTASGVTRMLIPLEKQGIIERVKDESDARARFAKLTTAGDRVLAEANFSLEIKLAELLETVKEKDISRFGKIFELISETFLEDEYKKEAKDRWGKTDAYKQSEERIAKMSEEEIKKLKIDGETLTQKIADNITKGALSKDVQALIIKHHKSINRFYDCSIEMYGQLGEMYVQDPRFRSYYDKFKPGLARFMRSAIREYCKKNTK
ncbi:hypothetical protein C0583_03415 [Candidatus Parcubacteria bacterium]|nr:MAG: hypothetical protein C0583_03415 [Candidatus Parcubacteria bacterium]